MLLTKFVAELDKKIFHRFSFDGELFRLRKEIVILDILLKLKL